MNKVTKKLLITSLGAISNLEYSTYFFDGDKSNVAGGFFTGDVLHKKNNYDYVIYVGTAKSQWEMLYAVHFLDESCRGELIKEGRIDGVSAFRFKDDDTFRKYKELKDYRIKNLSTTDIHEFNNSDIFVSLKRNINHTVDNVYTDNDINKQYHFLLMNYGVDEGEMVTNYNVLKAKLDYFKNTLKDEFLEVTFDMTGSLRLLPVYQMVFINYFNALGNSNIVMNKMFYSMFEVKNESNFKNKEYPNGMVPVIKLDGILELFSMVSGVSEFNNTGSLYALTKQLEQSIKLSDNNAKVLDLFKNFDYASGVNDMKKQMNSCEELSGFLERITGDGTVASEGISDAVISRSDSIRDAYILLKESIDTHFLSGINRYDKNWREDIKSVYRFQYNVGCWYFEQKRYGVATATALEALRTLLVKVYLDKKGIPVAKENYENEQYRKAAIDLLTKKKKALAENTKSNRTEIENLIVELEENRQHLKKLRDCFAHNLSGTSNTNDTTVDVGVNDIAVIKTFLEKMNRLSEELEKDSCLLECYNGSRVVLDKSCFIFMFKELNEEQLNDLKEEFINDAVQGYSSVEYVKFSAEEGKKELWEVNKKKNTYALELGERMCSYLNRYSFTEESYIEFLLVDGNLKETMVTSTYLREYMSIMGVPAIKTKYRYISSFKHDDRIRGDIPSVNIDKIREKLISVTN